MWDFDELPKSKLPDIKKALAGVTAPKKFKEYTEVPITQRLAIMEKVYTVLGKDQDWWEEFYRMQGYHYAKEGEAAKAAAARQRSLDILTKQLADPRDKSPRKLTLYVAAAMKHFLGDDPGALAHLETALKTKYTSATEKPDEVADAEKGLNERISDYITRIKSEKDKPRLFDKTDDDHGH